MSEKRGAGWWCWKPEVILRALDQVEPEDTLIYIDSGWTFKSSVRWISPYLDENHFVLAEAIPQIENMTAGYRTILTDCKRFCLGHYGIKPQSKEAKHRLISCGFRAMRNTEYVLSFMRTWMDDMVNNVLMVDDRLDIPKPEYTEFMRHMNDVAPLNVLLALRGGFFCHGRRNQTRFPGSNLAA